LEPGDEHLVEVDGFPHRDYGNWARDRAIARASGTHLLFIDDDDELLPGALEAVRCAVHKDPLSAWMFKVDLRGEVMWRVPGTITPGNQQGQCLVVPRATCPKWDMYPGSIDFHWIHAVNARMEVKWAEDLIMKIRPVPLDLDETHLTNEWGK
jgi:glycosyltransferase involved in cell wall biosynthesis